MLVKAEIDQLPPAALYDRFLRIAAEAKDDPKAVAAWERAGSKHFQQEVDTRVVAIAYFGTKIAPEPWGTSSTFMLRCRSLFFYDLDTDYV